MFGLRVNLTALFPNGSDASTDVYEASGFTQVPASRMLCGKFGMFPNSTAFAIRSECIKAYRVVVHAFTRSQSINRYPLVETIANVAYHAARFGCDMRN